jgi:hypothetical protein
MPLNSLSEALSPLTIEDNSDPVYLPADVRLFNENRALLVCLGKNFCPSIPSAGDAASGTYAGRNKKMRRPDVAEKMTSALKLISFHQ